MTPIRIQIWSGNVGGHMQAAQSIAWALKKLSHEIEVEIVDTCGPKFLFKPLSDLIYSYDRLVATIPTIWGTVYHIANSTLILSLVRKIVGLFTRRKAVIENLGDCTPHVIIRVIADLGQNNLLDDLNSPPPTITIITDPISVHRAWLSPHTSLYFVPTNEAKAVCIRYGIAEGKIRVNGFPIRTELFQSSEPSKGNKLSCDRFRILMMGGTSGAGRLHKDVRKLINSNSHVKLDITVVCGKNYRLFNELKYLSSSDNQNSWRLHVIGFTDQIPSLMKNSDVLITKAGPTTVYEAIACGLPVIINNYIPGQEWGNSSYFEQIGVAFISNHPDDTLKVVQSIIRNPKILAEKINLEVMTQTCQSSISIGQSILDFMQSRM